MSCTAVIPTYQAFSNVFAGSNPMLAYVMRNYNYWVEKERGATA
jgi:hypothetical protein